MAASGALLAGAGQQAGQQLWGSLPNILQGLFGNSGAPFKKAEKAYTPYYNEAKGYQNPFFNAGNEAIPQYQEWLSKMQDPSGFINNLMGQYQQSPGAKYSQQQAINAANNVGSASGLIGSTPLQLQAQQNAQNISSQDMNSWLQNVLGINSNYGEGLNNQVGWGRQSADILSQLAQGAGNFYGGSAYGQEYGKQKDQRSLWDGIAGLFGG